MFGIFFPVLLVFSKTENLFFKFNIQKFLENPNESFIL